MWFGIPTPDRSLIPQLASLVGFGTAVAFGWLIHRQLDRASDVLSMWRRQWPCTSRSPSIATIVCLCDRRRRADVRAGGARRRGRSPTRSRYGIAIWCWCFAVLGVAVRFCRSRALRRALCRRRVVLDLSGAPAGRRGRFR